MLGWKESPINSVFEQNALNSTYSLFNQLISQANIPSSTGFTEKVCVLPLRSPISRWTVYISLKIDL